MGRLSLVCDLFWSPLPTSEKSLEKNDIKTNAITIPPICKKVIHKKDQLENPLVNVLKAARHLNLEVVIVRIVPATELLGKERLTAGHDADLHLTQRAVAPKTGNHNASCFIDVNPHSIAIALIAVVVTCHQADSFRPLSKLP